MATKVKKRRYLWLLILLLIPLVVSVFFINRNTSHTERFDIVLYEHNTELLPDDELNFNLQEYWSTDLSRIDNTELNWWIYDREDEIEHDNIIIQVQNLNYSSPNWVGQEEELITIDSELYFSESLYQTNHEAPGILLLHGLFANKGTMEKLAVKLAENNFVVLAIDLPGHKDSGGAEPSINNLFPDSNFSTSAHPFLSIMAARQGLRVLQELKFVDVTRIGIYGESYGGLIAMYLSGLYPNEIALTVTGISLGNFESFEEDSYFYSLLGVPKKELGTEFWHSETAQIMDPMYYLMDKELPPIAWIIGTDDEIFDINGLNATFNAVQGPKWLQIHPNGHHALSNHEDTIKYLANHVLANQTAPPSIDKIFKSIKTIDFGDEITIKAEIDSMQYLESVELCYKYSDILGQPWKTIEMVQSENNTWIANIKHTLFNTNLDLFVRVNLDDSLGDSIFFTSNLVNAGEIGSNLSSFFWLMISTILLSLFIQAIHFKFRSLIIRSVEQQKKDHKHHKAPFIILSNITSDIAEPTFESSTIESKETIFVRKKRITSYLIFRTLLLLVTQLLLISTYFIPWTRFYKQNYTALFFINNFFTYGEIISFGYIVGYILIGITALMGILTLVKTLLAGILNVIWGLLMMIVVFIYSMMVNRSGFSAGISYGPFIIILVGAIQIALHKWFIDNERKLLHHQRLKMVEII